MLELWYGFNGVIYEGCGLGEASTSSTSILMVKRMERRNRGMKSILDIEDDAGPVFKCSRLAGAATYGTKYSIRATNLEVLKSLN